MNGDNLTKKVVNMKNQGFSDTDIINSLKQQSYSTQQISDAITQANIKDQIGTPVPQPFPEPPVMNLGQDTYQNMQGYQASNLPPIGPSIEQMPEPPAPPQPKTEPKKQPPLIERTPAPENLRGNVERMEEIAESIIQEKWEDLVRSVGDIHIWKEKVKTDILSVKQEIVRTQQRFENLQKAILGKVEKYDEDVRNIGSEMKALEKVFEKILHPLTTNVKELSKITKELKKKK